MEIAAILAREVLVIFLLIGAGILCKATGILDEKSAAAISNILLLLIIPIMIVHLSQTPWDSSLAPTMVFCLAMCFLVNLVNIVVATKFLPDDKDGGSRSQVARVAAVFANAGFMGIPLLNATVGDVGLPYAAMFIGVFNVYSWGWSARMLSGERLPLINLLKNPGIIAFCISIALFAFHIQLPVVVRSFLGHMSATNTPLSMMMIGVFLAGVNVKEALRDKQVYLVVFLRNILLPLITLAILWAVRITVWLPGGKTFAIAFMIMESCSAAASAILMPARYGRDSAHGAKVTIATTASVIVTLPLIVALANAVL